MFFNTDPQGNPLATPITNQTINFGWEYVWHCHILSHEEMDMMRPVSLALPPIKPDGLASTFVNVLDKNGKVVGQNVKLTWNDNSITETRFVVKRTTDGTTWTTVATVPQPLGNGNTHGVLTYTDTTSNGTTAYKYQVVAENVVGYGSGMPSMTVSSTTAVLGVNAPTAPTGLTAAIAGTSAAPRVNLTWQDTATTESRFIVQRSTDNGATFTQLATVGPRTGTGSVTYADSTVALNSSYVYRVAADNVAGTSAWSHERDRCRCCSGGTLDPDRGCGTRRFAGAGDHHLVGRTSGDELRHPAKPGRHVRHRCHEHHCRRGHHVHDRQHQPYRQLVLPDGCGERPRPVRMVGHADGDSGSLTEAPPRPPPRPPAGVGEPLARGR